MTDGGALFNPYEPLRRHPHWTLGFVELPDGQHGRWYEHLKTMLIDRRLSRVQRRCAVAHETVHAERGDVPCASPALTARQEHRTEQEAARRLIPLHRLIDALLWSGCDEELAEVLDVDMDMLRARSACLTPTEIELIDQRLAAAEQWIA